MRDESTARAQESKGTGSILKGPKGIPSGSSGGSSLLNPPWAGARGDLRRAERCVFSTHEIRASFSPRLPCSLYLFAQWVSICCCKVFASWAWHVNPLPTAALAEHMPARTLSGGAFRT